MTWRTYATCGEDQPPCDTFRGNTIEDGGNATLQIMARQANGASGLITSSTDQAQLPVGAFSLRYNAANGMAYLDPSPRRGDPLCGPTTPASACPY